MSRFWDWVALSLFTMMGYACLLLLILTRKKTLKEAKVLWRF
jgi:hypothetical protein